MLDDRNLRFDLFALGLLAFTIFLGLSLLTYSPADPLGEAVFPLNRIYSADQVQYPTNTAIQNVCGAAGATSADMLLRMFGLGAYAVLACLAAADVWLLMRKPISGAGTRLVGWLTAFVAAVTLVQMLVPNTSVGPVIGPGGYIGAMGRTFLESHFATVGSLILLGSLLLGGTLLCTDYVVLHIAVLAITAMINMMPHGLGAFGRLIPGRRRADALAEDEEYEYEEEGEEYEEVAEGEAASESEAEELDEFDFPVKRGRGVNDLTAPTFSDGESEEVEDIESEYEEDEESEFDEAAELEAEDADDGEEADADGEEITPGTAALVAKANAKLIKKPDAREEVIAQLEEASKEYEPQDYELPPISLLTPGEGLNIEVLKKEVRRKAALLEKTFEDFKLDVKVVDIETGPVIAQYEIALKRGLSIKKIVGLAEDLAIALRVPSVRIVAPIPGKNTVGIEVPNDERQTVTLREVMEETNGRTKKMSIPIFLGKDVSGNPLAVDLAKLPHLLIAGRTGTGKSVCLNAIISSMLMMKTPEDVRMLMIDPKMVELSGYARLPHLMHPVVTDMRKAEAILAWACEKMDDRYRLLARAGVRHINSYNQLGEEELLDRLKPETDDEAKSIPRHLPFIVIVADEMADLMMTAGKEVEAHIIRLASKSRAVGIHLILATQKPTVDVITGLIKSNLPARIAFQVASKTDSRVVLDENGADKLLGHGDLLFLWPGTSTLLRGQGTFLSDEEIDRIVDYCGSKGEQNFVRELVQLKVEDKDEGKGVEIKNRDDLYEEAIEVVVREGRGSVSLLQRNLQIGYGRAARLIDFMAEDGIVGTYNGSQAREVLMTMADWQASKSGPVPAAGAAATPALASPTASVAPVASIAQVAPKVVDTNALRVVASPAWSESKDDEVDEYDELEDDELEDEELAEEDDAIDELTDEYEEDEYEEEDDEDEEAAGDVELEDEDVEYEDEEDEYEEAEEDELVAEEEEEDEDDEYEDVAAEAEEEDEEEEEALGEAADADEETAWVEDEYEGEEFEPESYDGEEFQAAAKASGDLATDELSGAGDDLEYEDVDDYGEEIEEAKLIPKAKPKPKRKPKLKQTSKPTKKTSRRDPSSTAKSKPHSNENPGRRRAKKVVVNGSHD